MRVNLVAIVGWHHPLSSTISQVEDRTLLQAHFLLVAWQIRNRGTCLESKSLIPRALCPLLRWCSVCAPVGSLRAQPAAVWAGSGVCVIGLRVSLRNRGAALPAHAGHQGWTLERTVCPAWPSAPLLSPDPLSPLTYHLFVHSALSCTPLMSRQWFSSTRMMVEGWCGPHCAYRHTGCATAWAWPSRMCPTPALPRPLCVGETPLSATPERPGETSPAAATTTGGWPPSSSKAWQWLHLVEHLAHQRAPQHDMSKIIKIMTQGYQIAIQAIYSRFFCLS